MVRGRCEVDNGVLGEEAWTPPVASTPEGSNPQGDEQVLG
jgi:hypothetical protein